MLADPRYDLVVLDELTYMLAYHYLDTQDVIAAIVNRPEQQSVIVTGRGVSYAITGTRRYGQRSPPGEACIR
ncbi:cob(I)yrinic acid a,c-diamide adenosyltransferase [Citrobacter koseri]|uniref:corrinoid adenosyltransferase n=1 Tax=Citrobacter koseri TaxID=545 RepID=A0A2X2UWT0_CITKO|nr:cob(I)yrinic acid a,c-diamide adenosyltransferase [Citrobacter koseri]